MTAANGLLVNVRPIRRRSVGVQATAVSRAGTTSALIRKNPKTLQAKQRAVGGG